MNDRFTHLLLLVLVLGQLLLVAARPSARGSRLEQWTLFALGPLVHGVRATVDRVAGLGDAVASNRELREQNAALRDRLERARRQLLRLQQVEDQLERLARTSGYTQRDAGSFFVADVVFLGRGAGLRTLVLYTGSSRPRRNQAVRTPRGLVGRIIVAAGRYAKVQLITDRASAVGAMVERTRRRGLVRGATGGRLALDLLPLQADVRLGDRVVTAGIDGIYPRGIPIGVVTETAPGTGLFLRIALRPAIDFDLLDQVYVLTTEAVPSAMTENGDDGL